LAMYGVTQNHPAELAAGRVRAAWGIGDLVQVEPPDSVLHQGHVKIT
jgi:hypothetical protein